MMNNCTVNILAYTAFGRVLFFQLERFPEAALLLGQRESISLTLINPARLISKTVEIIYTSSRVCERPFPHILASIRCYQSLLIWRLRSRITFLFSFAFPWKLMSFCFSPKLCCIIFALMHCFCRWLELGLHVKTEGEDLPEGQRACRRLGVSSRSFFRPHEGSW